MMITIKACLAIVAFVGHLILFHSFFTPAQNDCGAFIMFFIKSFDGDS